MNISTDIPLIDELLDEYARRFDADLSGYRNHVYRMVNFCFAQGELDAEQQEKIVIAGCFHDLGIWSDDTLDYLPPSIALANEYLTQTDRSDLIPEISEMIDLHHKVRETDGLSEVFRKGDLVDFSLGFFRCGISRHKIREVKQHFPNAGFHKQLVRRACSWSLRHPLNPIPVLKW